MSVNEIEFVRGPLVNDFTREAAEQGLQRHAAIAKGAAYALDEVDGRWIAAIAHESAEKTANPFFGGPADQDEESPAPKSEGPDDTAPTDDSETPDDGGSDEAPGPDESPSEGSDSDSDSDSDSHDESHGKNHEIKELVEAVKSIADALGIPVSLGGGDEGGSGDLGPGGPGLDAGGPPPPPAGLGGPGGPGGPPSGGNHMPGGVSPGGPGGGDVKKVLHEKALSPGQVPPGATPAGAPAFSSVREDHPWAHLAGQVASWKTAKELDEGETLDQAWGELQSLAAEIGYKVTSFQEGRGDSNQRVAHAVVTKH